MPRLYTPPLVTGPPGACGCGCALDDETSFGFDLVWFALHVVGVTLDPWQRWCAIHLGELLPDGRPRFRTLLVLVARQNGKTVLATVLILFWLFIDLKEQADLGLVEDPFIIATSTDRSYAKKLWVKIGARIRRNPHLVTELGGIKLTVSEEAIYTTSGVEYGFAANNGNAGRSRTVHRALIDEVREHQNLDCWAAIDGAMSAVPDGMALAISNQGDAGAVLLDMFRTPAVAFIETGEGDPRLGLFEYSSPIGADPTDRAALRLANPGPRVDFDSLLAAGARAKRAGGEELTAYKTERMCQRVQLLDPAIDPDAWAVAGRGELADLAAHRERAAVCLDVALDGVHASLVAAALIDGVTHVDVVAAWDDLKVMRRELPAVLARIRARRFGWFPNGPAAAAAADLRKRPPRGVELYEITAETPAVCMALPPLVAGGEIRHGNDPMLDKHVERTQKLNRGDVYVYGRRGVEPIDASYAMAGAVHLARTMPPPRPPLNVA